VDELYAGQQVVGLDLHRRRTVMVRMTPAGERLEAVRFASDPAVLAEQIAKAGPSPEVVVEATTTGIGWPMCSMKPGRGCIWRIRWGVKGFAYRRAKMTFATLRTWRICCGWVDCPRRGSRPKSCGASTSWCATGTSCVSCVRGSRPARTRCWPKTRCRLALPEAYRVHLDSQLHLIDAFEAEIEDLDGRIRGLFDADVGYRALLRVLVSARCSPRSCGGEIGEIGRFPSPRQLNSWAGLTPRHRESDTTVHRGAITKMGCGGRRRRPMCVQR
jgi:hypothetical protein